MADTSSGVASRHTNLITELHENDVLLGRGTGARLFIGNQRFRILVAERSRERYNMAHMNKDKDRIARNLFKEIESLGGRFLKLVETQPPVRDVVNNGIWYEVEETKALEKCKQALRDAWVWNQGSSNGVNGGINIGVDISRERNIAGSFSESLGVVVDPASLTRRFVRELFPSLPSHFEPILPSIMHKNTGPFVGDVHSLTFQATQFALQQQITMAQLMATNSFDPFSFNQGVQDWNDANVRPQVRATFGSTAQGLFHEMYNSMSTSAAATAASLCGSSLSNNALISMPKELTAWQTDSLATAQGSATSNKRGNSNFHSAMLASKRKKRAHTEPANKAHKPAYQSPSQHNAIQGLLQLQTAQKRDKF